MLNVSPLNLLFVVLNLLILLALMKKFLYQPVLGVIEKRQQLLESQFAQAQVSREEAEQTKAQYEKFLAEEKEKQEIILRDAKIQAGTEYDKILEAADKKAKQMIEEAKKAGFEEKEKTIKEAETEIVKLAVAAASKIVAQTSDAKSDCAIYEEFLEKAGEKCESDGK